MRMMTRAGNAIRACLTSANHQCHLPLENLVVYLMYVMNGEISQMKKTPRTGKCRDVKPKVGDEPQDEKREDLYEYQTQHGNDE